MNSFSFTNFSLHSLSTTIHNLFDISMLEIDEANKRILVTLTFFVKSWKLVENNYSTKYKMYKVRVTVGRHFGLKNWPH